MTPEEIGITASMAPDLEAKQLFSLVPIDRNIVKGRHVRSDPWTFRSTPPPTTLVFKFFFLILIFRPTTSIDLHFFIRGFKYRSDCKFDSHSLYDYDGKV